MKRICRYLSFLSLLLLCIPIASAQSSVDFMLGFGYAHDGSNGLGIDNLSSVNALSGCTPGAGDPYCVTNPKMSSFFMGLGGDVMLWKRFGVGAEINFTPTRNSYGPFEYRQEFYDFNGIFQPVNTKRASLELEGGVGGSHTGFAINQCAGSTFCSSPYPYGSANHFQIHAGAGVSLFLTDHVFIRPQFDIHYVPGFTDEFKSNFVPAATIWIGFNFGERQ